VSPSAGNPNRAPLDPDLTAVIVRALGFLGFWLVLAGAHVQDLPAVVVAVFAATWTSLRLLPPGRWRPRPVEVARLALRFFRQSVIAGADVARRALDPRLPLQPGFVVYPVRLPAGPERNTFCALTSQVPGTVPCGPAANGGLLVHCLDVSQPVVAELAAEERRLVVALGLDNGHG